MPRGRVHVGCHESSSLAANREQPVYWGVSSAPEVGSWPAWPPSARALARPVAAHLRGRSIRCGRVSWLSWIVVGFLAGLAAKAVTGRRLGCLGTVVLGIVGGILGGVLFKAAGGESINRFSVYSILVAFVGATILLFAWGLVSGGRHRS